MKTGLFIGTATVAAVDVQNLSSYTFQHYLREFGKDYAGDEYSKREALFNEELQAVRQHNIEYKEGKHTWWAAVNEYSDWTELEFKKIKSGKAPHNIHDHPKIQLSKIESNPTSIDWREKNVVTPVKNQGGCGSCWAFSATEVVESHYAIATGELLELAPQAFVNCVQNPHSCGGTGGCEGATMELAFNLTRDMGMPLEADLPYRGRDQTCKPYKAAAKGTGYVKLPENDPDALETAIASKGPISVTVAANWGRYGGGVFDGGCRGTSCELDHGVVAVGYSQDYWLVRNSWGAGWGEGGYIRLTRKHDHDVFTDTNPASGVACKPYPRIQKPAGESGVLFDTSYPTGMGPASDSVVV